MGQRVTLPRVRMAVLQCVFAGLSWMFMGAVAYVLLQGKAPYPLVLSLLCASFAAVLTRVPGGLGTDRGHLRAVLAPALPYSAALGAAWLTAPAMPWPRCAWRWPPFRLFEALARVAQAAGASSTRNTTCSTRPHETVPVPQRLQ